MKLRKAHTYGVTLVELMITVAIISVIAAIAIPLYNGYIREAQFTVARSNLEPLRLALEDHWLETGTFADIAGDSWDPGTDTTLQTGPLGWRPDGDNDTFKYTVVLAGTTSWTVEVEHRTSGRKANCVRNGNCTFAE